MTTLTPFSLLDFIRMTLIKLVKCVKGWFKPLCTAEIRDLGTLQ